MRLTHDVETPENIVVWNALVKEITHRVDENLPWGLDPQHPFESLWKELHLGEGVGILLGHGGTVRTPEAIVLEIDGVTFVMKSKGITVVAPRLHPFTNNHRVIGFIRPFNATGSHGRPPFLEWYR